MASAAWEARNAKARAAGFRNYYDYRAHNYGRRETKAEGAELERLRGHRADKDLARRIAARDIELISTGRIDRDPKTGRFRKVEVMVVDSQGREARYRLGKLSKKDRDRLSQALGASGVRVAGYMRKLLAEADSAPDAKAA